MGTQTLATLSMSAPWKDPRTGIFYLRRRVPARFAGVASVPSGIIKWSLETKDAKEAKRKWPDALARWDAKEREWERQKNVVDATPEIAAQIAANWVAAVLAGTIQIEGNSRNIRALAFSRPGRRIRAGRDTNQTEAEIAQAVARTNEIVALHTQEALALSDIAIATKSTRIVHDAMLRAVRAAYSQIEHDNRPLPHQPLEALQTRLPAAKGPSTTHSSLSDLFDAWKAVTTTKPRSITETKYIIDALSEFLNNPDTANITRSDLIRWRDSMKSEGISNNTWNNRLSGISSVFKRAVDDGKLPFNPADGLRLPKAPSEIRYPYTDAEAVQILTAARLENRPERRWAHWIMAFTGMRVAEVLQLSVSDLQLSDGVHYFVIEGDSPEKSVKNGQLRHVPIHPALITEGLLTYASSLPAYGALFPEKKLDAHGLRGSRGWQTVGRWVREKVGITDPHKVPNHSWRHRVEDELRAAGVDESIRDALLGHARKTTGRIYGVRGEALRRLNDAITKIPVPPGL